jgi:hypothetical protein
LERHQWLGNDERINGVSKASHPKDTSTRHVYPTGRRCEKELTFFPHPVKISFLDSAKTAGEQARTAEQG